MRWAGWKIPLLEAAKIGLCALLVLLLWTQLGQNRQSATPFEQMQAAVTTAADLSPVQPGDNQMIKRLYGLDPAEFDGCLLYYPNTNMGAEELLLVRLRSTAQQDAVSAAVEARLAAQRSSFDGYGVEQMELLSRCVVEIRGNYVLFVVGADAQTVRQAFLDAL